MIDLHEQPRRGRPPRAETVIQEGRRERRRPELGDTDEASLKLAIPDWVKDKYPESEYVYRWFASSPARMLVAKRNDWDAVEGVDSVPATDKDGKPADHILHVKYRDWYDSDRAPKEARRKDLEKQMLRGAVKDRGDGEGDTLSEKFQYEEAASQNRLR